MNLGSNLVEIEKPSAVPARGPLPSRRPSGRDPLAGFASPFEPRPRRSVAASFTIHAMTLVVLLALPAHVSNKAATLRPIHVLFYTDAPEQPTPRASVDKTVIHEQPRPIERERVVELPPPPPELVVPPPPAQLEVESEPPPPLPEGEPAPPTPAPAVATVRTNVFGNAAPDAPAPPLPDREARTGLFGSAETGASSTRSAVPVLSSGRVGAFEVESGSRTGGSASRGATVESRTVASVGFDVRADARSLSRPDAPRGGSVKQGGFGDAVPAVESRKAPSAPAVNPQDPVEILSKPKPVYTEEARRLRVEGEVELEVLFGASGQLRVIRVLRGLGHGLDEAAVEAATAVRFKPARLDGRPIDYTATLRVVFQLA